MNDFILGISTGFFWASILLLVLNGRSFLEVWEFLTEDVRKH